MSAAAALLLHHILDQVMVLFLIGLSDLVPLAVTTGVTAPFLLKFCRVVSFEGGGCLGLLIPERTLAALRVLRIRFYSSSGVVAFGRRRCAAFAREDGRRARYTGAFNRHRVTVPQDISEIGPSLFGPRAIGFFRAEKADIDGQDMADLADLKQDLESALTAGDEARARTVRLRIVGAYPESTEAAEASFRLGLDALFRQKAVLEAEQHLRVAAKIKQSEWSPVARLSLGLVLVRQGKLQQGVFELRRVASLKPSNLVSAQAQGFLVLAFQEARKSEEADRARTDFLRVLRELADGGQASERDLAAYMLGMEFKGLGQRDHARRELMRALKGNLPEDTRQSAETALLDL
jgi:tetratricopeptide (TPR) repeat protein